MGKLCRTVVELRNGTLLMLMRSTDNFIFASTSNDQGVVWSPPLKTTIPNPDSKISALRLANGDLALAFNDHYRMFTGVLLVVGGVVVVLPVRRENIPVRPASDWSV
eukprot:7009693-Pyramimonas_sp.AAC.1